MYSNFKEQAIEYAKQAVHEDNAGNYNKAFPLYMNALEYFKTHLKYENNPKIREAITQKFTEYLRRAEEILVVLDEGESGPGSSGDTAVATKPKTKPKDGDGGGKDGEDPEQSKLRAGLNSTIVREKFNIKWSDVAGQISSSNSSSNSYNNESRPVCQICGKVGHTALKCWHRFDNSYQPDEAAQALAAMHITDVTERRGQEWYPGASAHVTNSAQHLQQSQPYKGNKETADFGKKP